MGMEITLFDYGTLSTDIAVELRGTAERVNSRFKRATSDIIENGRDLLTVKAHLKHGEFTTWVESELGMSARNAQTMMRAAEIAAIESEEFSLLQPSVALKLSAPSVSQEMRSAFVGRAAAGERVPVAAVDYEIRRIKAEREDQAKLEARSPAAKAADKRRREQAAVQMEESRARWADRERRQKARAADIARILWIRLPTAEWSIVMDSLSGSDAPHLEMLLSSMGGARYRDAEHDDYLPPAQCYEPDERLALHERRPDPDAPVATEPTPPTAVTSSSDGADVVEADPQPVSAPSPARVSAPAKPEPYIMPDIPVFMDRRKPKAAVLLDGDGVVDADNDDNLPRNLMVKIA